MSLHLSFAENHASCEAYRFSTAQFATQVGVEPQSVRKRYCQTGSYYGIRPKKLPNGKLRWPKDGLQRLLQEPDS